MWEEGARIYGTPRVPNNFSCKKIKPILYICLTILNEKFTITKDGMCNISKKKKKKNFIGAYLTGHHFNV